MKHKILLVADSENAQYYSDARGCLQHFDIGLPTIKFKSVLQLLQACRIANYTAVVLCDPEILAILLNVIGKATTKPSPQQWGGASFLYKDIRFVITRSFKQIRTTTTGKFIFTRHVYKNLAPYYTVPELTYDVVQGGTPAAAEFLSLVKRSVLVAVDIETSCKPTTSERVQQETARAGCRSTGIAAVVQNNSKKFYAVPQMDLVGYCCVWNEGGKLHSKSFIIHLRTMDDLYLVRAANVTDTFKVCQNGGYESTYFIRYGCPMVNFGGDTFHAMHSWFSELPRTLDFIASLFMPNYEYWKDLSGMDMDFYNAMDTYTTAWCWIIIIMSWPKWAEENYHIEFRKLFPNVCMGLEGVKVDLVERERLRVAYTARKEKALARLQTIIHPEFNPNSPKQVLAVMNALAKPYVYKSSDEKALEKWADKHPINSIISELILEVRECGKALSTYIETLLMEDRLLYELNAGGTTTGRASSKASNLWLGAQIQNQDTSLRSMYISDPGYINCSIDGSQAESRTTAYLSQDENLIDTVENAKDFHTRNASLFTGIPEDEIIKLVWETKVIDGVEVQVPKLDKDGKQVKDKSLRDLAKRINHGANYNMAAYVLVQTMGSKKVLAAQHLLKLPSKWRISMVAGYLLQLFENTYPRVKGKYYDEIIEEIRTTNLLRLPNGWTRRCFGTPSKRPEDKKHLNEYAAHPSQSLSVMLVDEGLFDFWLEYQLEKNLARVKAQVHDEVIYQSKPEHISESAMALSKLLMRPLEVHGRTLIIPNNGGTCSERWSELKD